MELFHSAQAHHVVRLCKVLFMASQEIHIPTTPPTILLDKDNSDHETDRHSRYQFCQLSEYRSRMVRHEISLVSSDLEIQLTEARQSHFLRHGQNFIHRWRFPSCMFYLFLSIPICINLTCKQQEFSRPPKSSTFEALGCVFDKCMSCHQCHQ